jgi:hypothetical protein
MDTRILVPLDGSALTEAIMKPAREYSLSDPSIASRLVDGLEAETQIHSSTVTDGVQCDGIQTFSLIDENPTAEALLAVADAIKVDRFAMSLALPAGNAG